MTAGAWMASGKDVSGALLSVLCGEWICFGGNIFLKIIADKA